MNATKHNELLNKNGGFSLNLRRREVQTDFGSVGADEARLGPGTLGKGVAEAGAESRPNGLAETGVSSLMDARTYRVAQVMVRTVCEAAVMDSGALLGRAEI